MAGAYTGLISKINALEQYITVLISSLPSHTKQNMVHGRFDLDLTLLWETISSTPPFSGHWLMLPMSVNAGLFMI
jgi:hypothetical protein